MESNGEHIKLNLQGAKPMLRVAVGKDEPFFGPGPAVLFELIEQTASVRAACTKMKMSYSKGFKIIRMVDSALGVPSVICYQGGPSGGRAVLSEAGRELLNRYRSYEKQVREVSAELFRKNFS